MSDLMNKLCAYFPSSTFRASGLIAAFAFLICLFAAQNAQAQLTFTVTRTDDRNIACLTGDCSLREAVNAANTAPTNDTINFAIPASSAGCTSGVCTITLTLGELAVNSTATAGTLTITNSTGASNLLISGNNTSRVFSVNSGANLTINGVTITNGNGTGSTNSNFNGLGGGILNNGGTLTLTNSTVSGNTANESGGGIYNIGTATLTNSTVSGNTANNNGGGGGILNNNNGTMTLTNSTVSGNTANEGGGGITNNGGGILNIGGTLNLTSVTVTQNKSTITTCTNCAGGINNFNSGIANLNNTIVAGNTVAIASSSPDFLGAVAAGSSFNLIGNNQGTTGITNGTNGNQVGTPASPIDPLLGALTLSNGGPTPTHALLPGSPAIDTGLNALAVDLSNSPLLTDQRGVNFPRIRDGNGDGTAIVDIGAFEFLLRPTAAIVSVSGRVLSSGRRGVSGAVVHLTKQNGEIQTTRTNSFGYYTFKDIAVGETYIINVFSKRYQFNPQVVSLTEDLSGLNFTAQ